MFYKLSNTSALKVIENEFNATFRFPNLYKPRAVISGAEESNLAIITSENPNVIDYSIWGLLPEHYDDDWDLYQSITNTLNTKVDDLDSDDELYSKAFEHRRCLIIVNGFFTSNILDGKLYPFHIHLKNHKPFCVAGIYNKLDDGFLTCSVLISDYNSKGNLIPHIGKQRPLAFEKSDSTHWLSLNKSKKDLKDLIRTHNTPDFISHPIKEDFYKNNRIHKQIIESVDYLNV